MLCCAEFCQGKEHPKIRTGRNNPSLEWGCPGEQQWAKAWLLTMKLPPSAASSVLMFHLKTTSPTPAMLQCSSQQWSTGAGLGACDGWRWMPDLDLHTPLCAPAQGRWRGGQQESQGIESLSPAMKWAKSRKDWRCLQFCCSHNFPSQHGGRVRLQLGTEGLGKALNLQVSSCPRLAPTVFYNLAGPSRTFWDLSELSRAF